MKKQNNDPDPDLGHLITFGDKADKAIKICRYALYLFLAFCFVALMLKK